MRVITAVGGSVSGTGNRRWLLRWRSRGRCQVTRPVKCHWDGTLRWFASKIANGILEGINSLLLAAKAKAKAKARSYRSTRNLEAIIRLIAWRLGLKLPI